MEIISSGKIILSDLRQALLDGKVIVYPTETCYGLGCDARNESAVARVFAVKQRAERKPLLVIVPDAAMIMEYAVWTPTLARLAGKYWPGPLTVVTHLRPEASLPAGIVGADNTLAFRVTSHPLAAELSRALGAPLVSTSANLAGGASSYSIEAVREAFSPASSASAGIPAAPQPDIVIDAGDLPERAPSTVVRVENEVITVIRQGEMVMGL